MLSAVEFCAVKRELAAALPEEKAMRRFFKKTTGIAFINLCVLVCYLWGE